MKLASIVADTKIEGLYLLKKFEVKNSRNGKKYADITLADKSASVNAKLWDISHIDEEKIHTGAFASIVGKVDTYNGNLQIVVNTISPATPTQEQLSELIATAPFDPEKMYDKIISILTEDVEDEELKKLTIAILEKNKSKLVYYPAAKSFHHATKGGLLHHVFTMLRSANQLHSVYPFLSKDILYTGIVLHDIGKIVEMTSDENGIVLEYSKEGQLLGHIITGICMIDQTAKELNIDPEKALLLKHVLLSHHGVPEYGSPKPPMLAEAEMIHYIDEVDARMNQFQSVLADTTEGTFSENVWILDRRSIYKHSIKSKDTYDDN